MAGVLSGWTWDMATPGGGGNRTGGAERVAALPPFGGERGHALEQEVGERGHLGDPHAARGRRVGQHVEAVAGEGGERAELGRRLEALLGVVRVDRDAVDAARPPRASATTKCWLSSAAMAVPIELRLACSAAASSATVCSGGSQIISQPATRPIIGGMPY